MNSLIPLEEQYSPEFVKLHNGFARKNSPLNKMICTKGPEYLGYFSAMMDIMGNYSKTDFALTLDEWVEEIQNYFALYSTPEEEIAKIVTEYIDAGILEKRMLVNRYIDADEVRYAIPVTQEDLFDSRSQWFGKIVAPMKDDNPDKERLSGYIEKEKAIRNAINKHNRNKRTYRDQLAQALARKDNEHAQVTNALIEHCEDDIKALYRELYGLVRQCPSLEQGGDKGNDGE